MSQPVAAAAGSFPLVEETPVRWRIGPQGAMRVPGVVFCSAALLPELAADWALEQVANVATLLQCRTGSWPVSRSSRPGVARTWARWPPQQLRAGQPPAADPRRPPGPGPRSRLRPPAGAVGRRIPQPGQAGMACGGRPAAAAVRAPQGRDPGPAPGHFDLPAELAATGQPVLVPGSMVGALQPADGHGSAGLPPHSARLSPARPVLHAWPHGRRPQRLSPTGADPKGKGRGEAEPIGRGAGTGSWEAGWDRGGGSPCPPTTILGESTSRARSARP